MYGVEQGLFVGVLLNFIPLLKLWTRPKMDFHLSSVGICFDGSTFDVNKYFQNKHDGEYLIIKPELGLYYSAVDYFTEEIIRISTEANNPNTIVIDCSNFLQVDYTATKVSLHNIFEIFLIVKYFLGVKGFDRTIKEKESRSYIVKY